MSLQSVKGITGNPPQSFNGKFYKRSDIVKIRNTDLICDVAHAACTGWHLSFGNYYYYNLERFYSTFFKCENSSVGALLDAEKLGKKLQKRVQTFGNLLT